MREGGRFHPSQGSTLEGTQYRQTPSHSRHPTGLPAAWSCGLLQALAPGEARLGQAPPPDVRTQLPEPRVPLGDVRRGDAPPAQARRCCALTPATEPGTPRGSPRPA